MESSGTAKRAVLGSPTVGLGGESGWFRKLPLRRDVPQLCSMADGIDFGWCRPEPVPMRIHQIAMHVASLDATEVFYREVVGARFVARFDPPGLLFFDFEGVRVLFETGGEGTGNSILYLWTDDLDARVADLDAKGVTFVHPPQAVHKDVDGTFGPAGETEWMAFFEDPNGNTVALATRRK